MNKPRLIVITGPAGAGKTTIGKRLGKELPNCAHIDVDYVKHFMESPFIYDDTPEGLAQWRLLGKNLGSLAKNFADAGYSALLYGYIHPESWQELEKIISIDVKILLLPELAEVTKRDSGRTPDEQMGHEAVATHHNHFSIHRYYQDFVRLDTTHQSIDETLALIREIIGA